MMKRVADALFLATLNLGNSIVQFKDIAEVGATGRYIPSRRCADGYYAITHTHRGLLYNIPTAWVSLCLVLLYRYS